MTLEDFIKKYDGKQVEFHSFSSGALYQCVDIVNAYIVEVLGLNPILGTNAVDFPSKLDSDYTYVKNTPDGVPLPGDVIVFKKYGSLYGTPGHIAVVKEATVNSMTVFEQNYPTGKPCKIGTHNYLGCVGWFRLNTMKTYTEAEWQTERDERNKNWELYQEQQKETQKFKEQYDNLKKESDGFLETLASKLTTIVDRNEILGALGRLLETEDQLNSANKKLTQIEKKHELEKDEWKLEMVQLRAAVEKQQEENERLLQRIDTLELQIAKSKQTEEFITAAKRLFVQLLDKIKKRTDSSVVSKVKKLFTNLLERIKKGKK